MSSTLSYAGRNIKWNTADDAKSLIEDLDKMKELKCLKLEANTLGVEAAKVIGDALAKHPEFERAHWKDLFTGRLKSEIPEALKHLFSGIQRANAKLIELDLSDNALGPIGVEGMVQFIKSSACYSLQELRLNNNGLGIKGGTMLAEALLELTDKAEQSGSPLKLKVFIAGRNRLENSGAKILSKFFLKVKTLEEIAMPQNGIFHPGIAALAKAFSDNPSLRIINLNDNTFTPVGARAMAQELPKMSNLQVINFGDCLLKTAGAIAVASALSNSHENLKELHLDSNEIGLKGGLAILDSVTNKPNIAHLMLDANQFGEDGLKEILKLLRSCGKENILGSMEDNEEPDDDDEDADEEGEEVEEEEEEEDDDDEYNDDDDDIEVTVPSKENSVQPLKCSVDEFLDSATAARLLGLPESATSLLESVRKSAESRLCPPDALTVESLIQEYVRLFISVASLSTANDKSVCERVEILSKEIVREIFELADKNSLLSIVTNALLVHLGLLKSEEKNFSIKCDLRAVVISLTQIASEQIIPKSTKDTLQFFFSRPSVAMDAYPEEKHKLLGALFKP